MGGQLGLESRTPGMDPAPIRTAEVTAATIAALRVVAVVMVTAATIAALRVVVVVVMVVVVVVTVWRKCGGFVHLVAVIARRRTRTVHLTNFRLGLLRQYI